MKTYKVEIVIKPWKEGGYLVEAALDDIQEVIALSIQAREKVGEPLPPKIQEMAPEKKQARLVLGVMLQ